MSTTTATTIPRSFLLHLKDDEETPFNMNRVKLINGVDCNKPTPISSSSSSSSSSTTAANVSNCIVYWMSRDQRGRDNWALLYARQLGKKLGVPVCVVFSLFPSFLNASVRHFGFMLRGLEETATYLHKEKQIPFHLVKGFAQETISTFANSVNALCVVADTSPLRGAREAVRDIGAQLADMSIPLVQVDAHNVVPVWLASDKQEYSARTIRSKIHKKLNPYLCAFPELEPNVVSTTLPTLFSAQAVIDEMKEAADRDEGRELVDEVTWLTPGYTAGMEVLRKFATETLPFYSPTKNNPNDNSLSNLSPYFHFGQLSVQAVIMELQENKSRYVKKSKEAKESVYVFFEESVVRRELAENYCFYNKHYDSIEGAPQWAQTSLQLHEEDQRAHLYTCEQLEAGETHDDLWNAAQLQMVREGKMHGFLRMYWAKKILEWTSSPREALRIAILFNDKYELDGRDPNGYVGCMWAIAGLHDQGWKEREVFGKVRFMNYAGCRRKFDVHSFVARYPPAQKNAMKFGDAADVSLTKKKTVTKNRKKAVKKKDTTPTITSVFDAKRNTPSDAKTKKKTKKKKVEE